MDGMRPVWQQPKTCIMIRPCPANRRGDRVADCAGLENQCARKGTQGLNPCLSALELPASQPLK